LRLRCALLLCPWAQDRGLRERADVCAVEAVALAALALTVARVHGDRRPVEQQAGVRSKLHQSLYQLLHCCIVVDIDAEEQCHLAVRHALAGGVADVALVGLEQRAQSQHGGEGLRLLEQQPPRLPRIARTGVDSVAQLRAIAAAGQRRRVGRVHPHCAAPELVLPVHALDGGGQVGQRRMPRQHVERDALHTMPGRQVAGRMPCARLVQLHGGQQLLQRGLQLRWVQRPRGRAGQLQHLGQRMLLRPAHLRCSAPCCRWE
jgi:DNA-binding NarL/FixJ family response regulator